MTWIDSAHEGAVAPQGRATAIQFGPFHLDLAAELLPPEPERRRDEAEWLLLLGSYRDGDARGALAYAQRQDEMARLQTPEFTAQACSRSCEAHLLAGQFPQALADLDHQAGFEPFPGVPVLSDIEGNTAMNRALVLSHLGRWEEAEQARERARSRADALGLCFAQPDILMRLLELHLLRLAAETLALNAQFGAQVVQVAAQMHADWARCMAQPDAELLARLQAAKARRRAWGERWHETEVLGQLASASLRCGDLAGAGDAIESGLAHARAKGEGRDLAELWRLRGDLNLQRGDSRAAASDYRQAIELARSQHSLLYALRASTSLAQLLAQQGASAEAGALLDAALEGLDHDAGLVDLSEALALRRRLRPEGGLGPGR